jgi:hypothetical protein
MMDSLISVLGLTTILAGLMLTAAFTTVDIKTGTPESGLMLFGLSALLLLGVPVAFLDAGLSQESPGQLGIPLTIAGLCIWIVGMFYIRAHPAREFRQPFTPLGSFAMSIGMILTGIAVLNADILDNPWRFLPLLTGLFFLAQFPVQAIFFIRTQGAPSYRVLGGWGLLWALCGLALLTLNTGPAA